MKKWAYYNENDAAAAHVIRTLIDKGVVAPGVVDERSIKDVASEDFAEFAQCHWFAGGALWSVAARLAGWPDERPLWTGSCPCQGESVAGKRLGAKDPRHLWPDFFRLIRAARPALVVGEQVAAAAGTHWLDGVAADLESENYAARAVDIPACAVDAPHIRSRLYWCAVAEPDSGRQARGGVFRPRESCGADQERAEPELRGGRRAAADPDAQITLGDGLGARLEGHAGHGDPSRGSHEARPTAAPDGRDMGDGSGDGREQGQPSATSAGYRDQPSAAYGCNGLHADANGRGCAGRQEGEIGQESERAAVERDLPRINGTHWSDAEWIICHDGKARRAKPGLRLLVDGFPGRVDLWRIAGNAIVPQAAIEVIGALMDVLPEWRASA